MKNFDWDAFKTKKIAVHTPTEELDADFRQQAEAHGCNWDTGHRRGECSNWSVYREGTCHSRNCYCDIHHYIEDGYTILEWSDYASHRDTYQQALDTYGAEAQIKMLFEEMAGLQMAICKNGRGADNRDNIAEKIADVQIMLEQMAMLYECETLVEEYRRRKLGRLRERLEEGA